MGYNLSKKIGQTVFKNYEPTYLCRCLERLSLRPLILSKKAGKAINSITITLDTHETIDVAHSMFWINGTIPQPFRRICTRCKTKGIGDLMKPFTKKWFIIQKH